MNWNKQINPRRNNGGNSYNSNSKTKKKFQRSNNYDEDDQDDRQQYRKPKRYNNGVDNDWNSQPKKYNGYKKRNNYNNNNYKKKNYGNYNGGGNNYKSYNNQRGYQNNYNQKRYNDPYDDYNNRDSYNNKGRNDRYNDYNDNDDNQGRKWSSDSDSNDNSKSFEKSEKKMNKSFDSFSSNSQDNQVNEIVAKPEILSQKVPGLKKSVDSFSQSDFSNDNQDAPQIVVNKPASKKLLQKFAKPETEDSFSEDSAEQEKNQLEFMKAKAYFLKKTKTQEMIIKPKQIVEITLEKIPVLNDENPVSADKTTEDEICDCMFTTTIEQKQSEKSESLNNQEDQERDFFDEDPDNRYPIVKVPTNPELSDNDSFDDDSENLDSIVKDKSFFAVSANPVKKANDESKDNDDTKAIQKIQAIKEYLEPFSNESQEQDSFDEDTKALNPIVQDKTHSEKKATISAENIEVSEKDSFDEDTQVLEPIVKDKMLCKEKTLTVSAENNEMSEKDSFDDDNEALDPIVQDKLPSQENARTVSVQNNEMSDVDSFDDDTEVLQPIVQDKVSCDENARTVSAKNNEQSEKDSFDLDFEKPVEEFLENQNAVKENDQFDKDFIDFTTIQKEKQQEYDFDSDWSEEQPDEMPIVKKVQLSEEAKIKAKKSETIEISTEKSKMAKRKFSEVDADSDDKKWIRVTRKLKLNDQENSESQKTIENYAAAQFNEIPQGINLFQENKDLNKDSTDSLSFDVEIPQSKHEKLTSVLQDSFDLDQVVYKGKTTTEENSQKSQDIPQKETTLEEMANKIVSKLKNDTIDVLKKSAQNTISQGNAKEIKKQSESLSEKEQTPLKTQDQNVAFHTVPKQNIKKKAAKNGWNVPLKSQNSDKKSNSSKKVTEDSKVQKNILDELFTENTTSQKEQLPLIQKQPKLGFFSRFTYQSSDSDKNLWYYVNDAGFHSGPFSSEQMDHWYANKRFHVSQNVSLRDVSNFVSISQIERNPNIFNEITLMSQQKMTSEQWIAKNQIPPMNIKLLQEKRQLSSSFPQNSSQNMNQSMNFNMMNAMNMNDFSPKDFKMFTMMFQTMWMFFESKNRMQYGNPSPRYYRR